MEEGINSRLSLNYVIISGNMPIILLVTSSFRFVSYNVSKAEIITSII